MKPGRVAILIKWLLRLIAASVCLAVVPVFFPLSWMAAIHAWLGLGDPPEQPIFEYLSRSLSAMYFAHGCIVWLASTDVYRFAPLIRTIGWLNLFLGCVLFATDLRAPMPLAWTLLEGPPIAAVGILLLCLLRKM